MTPRAALERGLAGLALEMPAGACERLERYLALIAKWNRTYNLTAIRDPHAMVSQHLLDSLAVLAHLPDAGAAGLADVGSGAGLPGLPIALARPLWRVTLNDKSAKKAAFLRQAVIELGLPNVAVHEGPVEAFRPVERFAVVISRAFARVEELMSRCAHLLAPGGMLAAMVGAAPERTPGGCRVVRLDVPLLDARRHLVLCPASA